MYRDRDDSESAHFGGQGIEEGEWVDFPPSLEEPSRVPARVGRAVVLAPTRPDAAQPRPETDTPMLGKPAAAPVGKRQWRLKLIALSAVAMAALAAAGYFGSEWWTTGRFMVSTDDAYVGADT